MLVSISIIPDLLPEESLLWVLMLYLTAICLCILAPIYHFLDALSRLCFASIQTQTCHVNVPFAKQIGALCTRKACLRLVILKLKACLFVQLQFQEWGRECECECVARWGEHQASAVIFTAKESHRHFLSISLDQETSGRKGRRIRLARERKRKGESGFSNPDGIFQRYTHHYGVQCAVGSWYQEGRCAGRFASLNPSHLHERGSSKLGD